MPITEQALRTADLFAGLSDSALAHIARVTHTRVVAPGEMILLEGEPCSEAYIVGAGLVRVYRLSPGGRQQVLVQLGPGDAFKTGPAFQSHGVNHATVEGVACGTLYVIGVDDLRRLVRECPEVGLAMLEDFAEKLDHLTDLVEDLALRTVRGRLARFLLVQADERGTTTRWTQDDIAARIGTVRDMVGRILRSFVDAGWIVRGSCCSIVRGLSRRLGADARSQSRNVASPAAWRIGLLT